MLSNMITLVLIIVHNICSSIVKIDYLFQTQKRDQCDALIPLIFANYRSYNNFTANDLRIKDHQ